MKDLFFFKNLIYFVRYNVYFIKKYFILGLMIWGKDDDFDIFIYCLKKNCFVVNYLIVYIDEKCFNSYYFSRINMYIDIKSMFD